MRRRVLIAALVFDLLFGEPPNRYHPVAWMGQLIGWLQHHAPKKGQLLPFLAGGGISLGGALLVFITTRLIIGLLCRLPYGWLMAGLLLKVSFSLRGLNDAAEGVEQALAADDLVEARRLLSWHLVSRDTKTLSGSQITAAAIESVAENTSDGIIAPLFYYMLGGLPAAYAYRYLQTCDSMLGYRDVEREWLGKIPARVDDMLNLIPARLTALLFIETAHLTGDDPQLARRIWWRDNHKTDSPNAGHPMSAAAGALGVELEKIGHYRLGEGLHKPTQSDIQRVRRLMFAAVGLFFVGAFILIGGKRAGSAT